MIFTDQNKLVIWFAFRSQMAHFPFYSVPYLLRSLMHNLDDKGVQMIVPVLATHAGLPDFLEETGKFKNVEFVPIGAHYHKNSISLSIEDLYVLRNRQDWEVVLNCEPEDAHILAESLRKDFCNWNPKIVNYVLFSMTEDGTKSRQWRQVTTIFAHPSIFNSSFNQRESREVARQFLSMSVLRDYVSATNDLGIATHDIDAARVDRPPPEGTFRFIYGGRMPEYKRVRETVDVSEKLRQGGRDVECLVHTYTPIYERKLREIEADVACVTGFYSEPRSTFYGNMFRAHAFICMSKAESYGISYYEMLYSGLVGIFLRRPWQDAVLPKSYPFIAENKSELRDMALWIMANYADAQKKIQPTIDWIAENQNQQKQEDLFLGKLEGVLCDGHRFEGK